MTEKQQIAITFAREHHNYEKRVRPIFLNAARKNAENALNWIDANGVENVPLNLLVNSSDWIRPMQQAYSLISNLSAKREYYYQKRTKADIDILLDVWSEIFKEYATRYAYRIDNELAETTRETIRQSIQDGFDLKLNGAQLSTFIRKKVLGEISRNRANTIARTESTTAANLGKEQGAKSYFEQQNTTGYKEWITRIDGKERISHHIENDTIIPIDDKYVVGGEEAERPGDPNLSGKQRCNCRCTQIFMSAERYRRIQANKK
jgi:hypothetical protein